MDEASASIFLRKWSVPTVQSKMLGDQLRLTLPYDRLLGSVVHLRICIREECRFFTEICIQYGYQLSCDVYHRTDIETNVRQGNVLLAPDGKPLLCDFGLSRIRHEVTRTHTMIREGGRVRYMAPELLDGPGEFRTSKASDIYALAMTFLSAGTLQQPFDEYSNSYTVGAAVRSGARPKAFTTINGLSLEQSKRFYVILEAMWRQEPSMRLSAVEVEEQMELFLGSHAL